MPIKINKISLILIYKNNTNKVPNKNNLYLLGNGIIIINSPLGILILKKLIYLSSKNIIIKIGNILALS